MLASPFILLIADTLLMICFLSSQSSSVALQIRADSSRPRPNANVDCEKMVTASLVCPNSGRLPVMGTCEYFAHCIQTTTGLESEVEFCPDGHIYFFDRCIKSENLDDCPQKKCVIESTGLKQTNPETIHEISQATWNPKTTTNKPFSHYLHPHLKNATFRASPIRFYSILLPTLTVILITNNY